MSRLKEVISINNTRRNWKDKEVIRNEIYRNAEGYYDPTAGNALKNIERRKEKMRETDMVYRGDIYYIDQMSWNLNESRKEGPRPAVIPSGEKEL